MATWSVVTTVRAPQRQCELFVNHYLSIGASRVFLYNDDPEMACNIKDERVTNVVCNAWWWRHGRPEGLEDRQRINATKAKNWTTTQWIIHCDVDELVWSEEPISDILDWQPENIAGLKISPAEAVYASEPSLEEIYSTPYFKFFSDTEGNHKAYGQEAKICYGELAHASKNGFWGHVNGKSFIRKVPGLGRMPLHHKAETVTGYVMRHKSTDILLRHYDTTTYDEWRAKHLRRISGEVLVPQAGRFRKAQQALINAAWEANGEDGLRDIYLKMTTLDKDLIKLGLDSGFIREIQPEAHLIDKLLQ